MSECSFWPVALIACLLLASCEGATYLNHHLTNDTSDTLRVGFRTEESTSGWHVDTVWVLAPGETHVHYAVDLRGKCHDCTPYEALPYGIDSMWVDNRTLAVDLLDSALWEVHVDEGLSWILHDQHLDLVPSHFD